MLSPQLSTSNITIQHQDSQAVFAPVIDAVRTVSVTASTHQKRDDSTCAQTIEVPIWYGVDYNTCSMQTTTAPCSVSFPTTSCHTARPSPLPQPNGMPGTASLWIVIGLTVLFTIIIPVVVLYARWRLRVPRRGGKRSISIQLEKNEDKESSKAISGSSSTSKTNPNSSSSKTSGSDRRTALDRLLGRNHADPAQSPRKPSPVIVKENPATHSTGGGIHITNNIHINRHRPTHQPPAAARPQHPDEPPPMSPRIALESLPLNHPARLPENQPWMHQDRNGRWVPREEGYLFPGLPPPPRPRDVRNDGEQVQDAGRGRLHVPGGWRG